MAALLIYSFVCMIISLSDQIACANYKIMLTFKRDQKGSFISNRFFENQLKEICSHLSEKASKARFLKPEKLKNHSNEGKGKEKKKERGEEKKAMAAFLVFIIGTLEIVFGRKKVLDAKGPFGDNVFKI